MHSVIINGKKFSVEDNAPLKEPLIKAGFRFPCGGTGRCGKCRITCEKLPVTEKDRRFLSSNLLESGVRLACDKKVTSSFELTCETDLSAPEITLKECSIAACITDEEISISIVGDETVETVTRPNPLAEYQSMDGILTAYSQNPCALTNALRAVIGKESVELFEKYNAAKAMTAAVAAKGAYLKILAGLSAEADADEVENAAENDCFGLPAESLYILPCKGDFFGGELLAEAAKLKERSLLIDCEKTVAFLHIGDKDDIAAAIWDCDYSAIALRCIKAAVRFLIKDMPTPTVYLYGKNAYAVEEALEDLELTVMHRDKSPESVADALLSLRTRGKLLKEKARTTFISLYTNELFQTYLNEE